MASGSSIASMFCARRISAFGLLLGLSSLLGVSSCLYDSSNRCDKDQKFDADAGLCVCDAAQNKIAGDLGCVDCGANEVAGNDVCTCAPGFSRAAAGSPCTDVPPGLGAACQKDADCVEAAFPTCHVLGDGSGYCTSTGCASSSDCFASYACDTAASPAYCVRPPTGSGVSCASDADCAGTEATFCEIFNTHVCYVKDCSLTKNDCFPGKECCDLTKASLGTITSPICVDAGSCPAQ